MTAFAASTGPLAPLALGIESPLLAGSFAMRKINKLAKSKTDPKVNVNSSNGLGAGGKPTPLVREADDGIPSVPENKVEQTITFKHQLKKDKVTDIEELNRQVKGQENGFNKIIQEEGVKGLQNRVKAFKTDPNIATEGRKRTRNLGPA